MASFEIIQGSSRLVWCFGSLIMSGVPWYSRTGLNWTCVVWHVQGGREHRWPI